MTFRRFRVGNVETDTKSVMEDLVSKSLALSTRDGQFTCEAQVTAVALIFSKLVCTRLIDLWQLVLVKQST